MPGGSADIRLDGHACRLLNGEKTMVESAEVTDNDIASLVCLRQLSRGRGANPPLTRTASRGDQGPLVPGLVLRITRSLPLISGRALQKLD